MNIPAEYFRKGSRNKYGAKKTIVGNITLDSKLGLLSKLSSTASGF